MGKWGCTSKHMHTVCFGSYMQVYGALGAHNVGPMDPRGETRKASPK